MSHLMLPSCLFIPSCSTYAEEAIKKHGLVAGLLMVTKRIIRCQPLCRGGFDPVPPPVFGPKGRCPYRHNAGSPSANRQVGG